MAELWVVFGSPFFLSNSSFPATGARDAFPRLLYFPPICLPHDVFSVALLVAEARLALTLPPTPYFLRYSCSSRPSFCPLAVPLTLFFFDVSVPCAFKVEPSNSSLALPSRFGGPRSNVADYLPLSRPTFTAANWSFVTMRETIVFIARLLLNLSLYSAMLRLWQMFPFPGSILGLLLISFVSSNPVFYAYTALLLVLVPPSFPAKHRPPSRSISSSFLSRRPL